MTNQINEQRAKQLAERINGGMFYVEHFYTEEQRNLWREHARALYKEEDDKDAKIKEVLDALDLAVQVAWNRGAREWVRFNYPEEYKRFMEKEKPDVE
jgi:hypothetical protein